jgi:hypothetical protein
MIDHRQQRKKSWQQVKEQCARCRGVIIVMMQVVG